MFKIGLLLGAGPTVSSWFYRTLMLEIRKKYDFQPELYIYNLFINVAKENQYLENSISNIDLFNKALNDAIKFFIENNINSVSFPCFSLTPIFKQACGINNISLINPFNEIGNIKSNYIGIIAANDSRDLAGVINENNSKNLYFYMTNPDYMVPPIR